MNERVIQKTLLIELHGAIEDASKDAVAKLGRGDPFLSPEGAVEQAAAECDLTSELKDIAPFADPVVLRADIARTKAALVSYPPAESPGAELSQAEHEALASMSLTPDARSALEKLVSDAAARALFRFFCLIDAVGDPQIVEVNEWLGAAIGKRNLRKHYPMLHDEFMESYWHYRELKRGEG